MKSPTPFRLVGAIWVVAAVWAAGCENTAAKPATPTSMIFGTDVTKQVSLGDERSRVLALIPRLEPQGRQNYRIRLEDETYLSLVFGEIGPLQDGAGAAPLRLVGIMQLWVHLASPDQEWMAATDRISGVATDSAVCEVFAGETFFEARSVWPIENDVIHLEAWRIGTTWTVALRYSYVSRSGRSRQGYTRQPCGDLPTTLWRDR